MTGPLLLLLATTAASAQPFTYTKLFDSSTQIDTVFSGTPDSGGPSINRHGDVVFLAAPFEQTPIGKRSDPIRPVILPNGASEVTQLVPNDPIVGSSPLAFIAAPTINDDGLAASSWTYVPGTENSLVVGGPGPNDRALTLGDNDHAIYETLSVLNNGSIVTRIVPRFDSPLGPDGIYRIDVAAIQASGLYNDEPVPPGIPFTELHANGWIQQVDLETDVDRTLDPDSFGVANNQGQIVYASNNGTITSEVVRVTDSQRDVVGTISTDYKPLLDIADNGTVAFSTTERGADLTVVHEGQAYLYDDFRWLYDKGWISVNQSGTVAFLESQSGNNRLSIGYIPLGGEPVTVIEKGQQLFGGTLFHLSFSKDGLNDRNQLVFGYELLETGERGIAMVTIPEPAALALLGLGLVALTTRRRRHG